MLFWKSKEIPMAHSSLSKEFRKFLSKIINSMYVEWLFLKPNWYLSNISFLFKKAISLPYIKFSMILENVDSSVIGR